MAETLNRYGIPLGGGDGRGGILMPKLKYRFRVRTVNFGPRNSNIDFTKQIMMVDKPRVNFETVQLDSYNSRAWVHGKHTWETINVTLRDDITNTIARLVGTQVQKQLNHFEQTAFAAGQNYKFDMYIETMDGGNDVVLEQWFLEGCFLTNISYENLDYSASEAQQISLTVQYDNATQSDGLFPELISLGDIIPGSRA
ncbi:MAG: hypothetical protein WC284_13635 [Candidimonas sp.]